MTQDQFEAAYARLENALPVPYNNPKKKISIYQAVLAFEIQWLQKTIDQILKDPTKPADIVKLAESEYKSRIRTQKTKEEIAHGERSWNFLSDQKKEQALSQFGGAKTATEALANLLKEKKQVRSG